MNKKPIIGFVILIMLSLSASAVTTKFPIFENGRLIVSKPGYYPAVQELTTEIGKSSSLEVKLEPFRYKNLTLKKFNIEKSVFGIWKLAPAATGLRDDEEALITITKINSNPYEEELFNVIRITSEQQKEEIKLVPGTYEVEVSLYYKPIEGSILIPQDRICGGWGPFKKCVTVPEIRAPGMWPLGSVKYKWTIQASDLRGSNTLEFYGVSLDIPGTPLMQRKHRDLENLDKIDKFVADYSILKPRLI